MLIAAQRRAGLGHHPQLPDQAQVAVTTADRIAYRAALIRRMHTLLDSLADRLPAWLVASLHADLDQGKTGDAMSGLRTQLAHLGVSATAAELAEFEALAATQQ